jgi:hypothetical protein
MVANPVGKASVRREPGTRHDDDTHSDVEID